MALAFFLKTEQLQLATARAVLKREEVAAVESAVDLLAKARAEAEQMRAAAEQAARELSERTRDQANEEVRSSVAQAVAEVHVNAGYLLRQLEQAVVEIVVETIARVARRIDRRQILATSLEEVRRLIENRDFAVLKVSPSDLTFTQNCLGELMSGAQLPATFAVRADPGVAVGECVLIGETGKITMGLQQHLGALAAALQAFVISGALPVETPYAAVMPPAESSHG